MTLEFKKFLEIKNKVVQARISIDRLKVKVKEISQKVENTSEFKMWKKG